MNMSTFREGEESEPGMLTIYLEYPIGASGAPGTKVRGRGILSLTRTGAGLYTLALEQGVVAIVAVDLNVFPASYAAAEGNYVVPLTRTPGGATPGITFTTAAGSDGTAADPDNGSAIAGSITVQLTNA